jgi:hypothetical protein
MTKRLSVPMMFLCLLFILSRAADAQPVTCTIAASATAILGAPALPGVTANASDIGQTEVGAAGPHGIADTPGGGRVRISCAATAAVNPGVVVLTVKFSAPVSNTQTYPTTSTGIRLINGTGDFVTPGPAGPSTVNPGNIGIAEIDNAGGKIVIGLGTPGTTMGDDAVPPVVPTNGIAFTAGRTSTFELAGWLLSTNGKTGPINASLSSAGGVHVGGNPATCTEAAGACTQVITTIKPSLQDASVPGTSLPSVVTSLPNSGTTAITGGPAVLTPAGNPLKTNFTIRLQENYPDLFKSTAQFNAGAVSIASSMTVNVVLSNVPAGLDISGCSAVLTDVNGTASSTVGFSVSGATATSLLLTAFFNSSVDQDSIDVLWITCTKVGPGSAALPLPSAPVTAQVYLGATGDALSPDGSALTGLLTGTIPRYAPPSQLRTVPLGVIAFGTSLTQAPSGIPATILATEGTGQTAQVGTAFNPLRVLVKDRFDNPVSGATVTFTSDAASSAGVTFPLGNTAVTDTSGHASIAAQANFSIGTYTVTASCDPATVATFTLTNTQRLTVAVPALLSGNANQLGIAWTNTSSKTITLRATGRGYNGQLITGTGIQNPSDVTVLSGTQIAKLGTEIFGTGIAGRSGWVELTASDAGIDGFFEIFDNALSTFDGAAFPIAPASHLVFPHVDKDTVIHVVNTGDQPAGTTAFFVFDNNGVLTGSTTISISAKGGWSGHIGDLIPSVQAVDGYLVVDTAGGLFATPSETLVGMQTYNRGDAAIVLAQRDSERIQSGYAAHVAVGGGYASRLTLVNPGSAPQTVQLTLNGITIQRIIQANSRLDESLAETFSISGAGTTTGYLKVQTSDTPGLHGYVEISFADGLLRTTTPIAREAQTRLVFSHLAQGSGFFTGLVLLNTQTASASVTLEVHDLSGAIIASKVVTVAAGERLVGTLNELFPAIQTQLGGFVRVVSTVPIYGLQIIGSGTFLTNIPAEPF